MDDLTAFVTARLDEDEAAAQEVASAVGYRSRALREVEAKRAMVELARQATQLDMAVEKEYATAPRDLTADPWHGDLIIRTLAAVWSDHPDYRQEWKP